MLMIEAGGKQMLIPLENVREILPFLQLEAVADTRSACLGLANLRTEWIPVFPIEAAVVPKLESMIVVCEELDQHVGILVDNVFDLFDIASTDLATKPLGNGRQLRYAKVQGVPITILELHDVIHRAA